MSYTRQMLNRWFGGDERMIRAMEDQQLKVEKATDGLQTTATSTERIEAASVLVLASNNAFTNERVLALGAGISGIDDGTKLTLQTSIAVPIVGGGYSVNITAVGNSNIRIPLTGTLATVGNAETLGNKTLTAPKIGGIADYATDVAAAAGGVPINGLYHNAGAIRIRLA